MQISNRVMEVQEDADSMLTQFEDSEDVVTSQYVICNRSLSLHRSYGERLVVARTSKDPFYCNGPSECQSGADEMCWQVGKSNSHCNWSTSPSITVATYAAMRKPIEFKGSSFGT